MRAYYQHAGITIYHGDCREILPHVIGVDAFITDPPYGIGRRYGDAYDDSSAIYWDWFLPTIAQLRMLAPVVAFTHLVSATKRINDWDWLAAWVKPWSAGARIGNSPVLPHWEAIFLYGIYSLGTKREAFPDVLTVNPESSSAPRLSDSPRDKQESEGTKHPLPKPLRLFQLLVKRLTDESSLVCDPFCGSGTTLVAAKNLGRYAIGIEIEEKYCEIAAKRLSQEVFDFSSEAETLAGRGPEVSESETES